MIKTDEASDTPRFIVGMSRGGTTWVGKCLNEHPSAAVFGETLYWGRGYVTPEHDGYYSDKQFHQVLEQLKNGAAMAFIGTGSGNLKHVTQQNLPAILDQAFSEISSPMRPEDVFTRTGQAIARAEGKPVAIEKTPHHLNWIDRIIKVMPRARFVVMVRDPYGFMLSYKHQGDRQIPAVSRIFHRLYHPALCRVIWRGYMRAAQYASKKYPGQVLLVRFDQLREDPKEAFDRIQRFFLLEPVDLASRVPPDNSSFPSVARPQLQSDDLFWMNLFNRRFIRYSGFQVKPVPLGLKRIILSVVLLPFWVVRTLLVSRRLVSGSLTQYIWKWLWPGAAR